VAFALGVLVGIILAKYILYIILGGIIIIALMLFGGLSVVGLSSNMFSSIGLFSISAFYFGSFSGTMATVMRENYDGKIVGRTKRVMLTKKKKK